eukprot:TRINITY_DN3778_c0_g1_i1.p1 TRINITY_DN3778_c0_g1~~TRINITY_DN3778_c0_g1_i1.p1  ORF type:complete len:250 (-),score=26.88 TRINITY_DN3778_c0_g1_i1:89-838(-)
MRSAGQVKGCKFVPSVKHSSFLFIRSQYKISRQQIFTSTKLSAPTTSKILPSRLSLFSIVRYKSSKPILTQTIKKPVNKISNSNEWVIPPQGMVIYSTNKLQLTSKFLIGTTAFYFGIVSLYAYMFLDQVRMGWENVTTYAKLAGGFSILGGALMLFLCRIYFRSLVRKITLLPGGSHFRIESFGWKGIKRYQHQNTTTISYMGEFDTEFRVRFTDSKLMNLISKKGQFHHKTAFLTLLKEKKPVVFGA